MKSASAVARWHDVRPLALLAFIAIAIALSHAPAHADPHQWIDDQVRDVVDVPFAGGRLAVEKRTMLYGSGYLYVALTAIYRPSRGPWRRTLLAEGPTMCSDARVVGASLVVETCLERFSDLRETIRWRFDRTTGRFIAGRPRVRSPYAEQARAIVDDLRAGRETRAAAALARLGDSPDGQATITWWWSAQRLLAAWPSIARARPAEARRRLAPHVERLLARDDSGDPSVRTALDADLSDVPRCSPFRVAGPRRLAPIVPRVVALLRAGDADHVALADALVRAAAAE